ncbi:DEBR0S4_07184g1_1 [Brettanomyces bruxellensis]|uniref:DEBR0S4_07184g1_1 n=1 Tax=Dekkera bruxellensis TaxID=5007 RepID=A0A7D9H3S8_DEKBR|nr:DEBR0S4_07184g1_1 [Brettanomyces bruxellensis]
MNEELDNSLQLEQFTQVKSLLNRLLQSLDDENHEKAKIDSNIVKLCKQEKIDPDTMLQAKADGVEGELEHGNGKLEHENGKLEHGNGKLEHENGKLEHVCDKVEYNNDISESKHGELPLGNDAIERENSLRCQRDLLLSRLQREKYLSKQYEDLLRRHEKLMRIINNNLNNRMKLEQGANASYNAEAERQLRNYAESIKRMRQVCCDYNDEYGGARERLCATTKEFNKALNE